MKGVKHTQQTTLFLLFLLDIIPLLYFADQAWFFLGLSLVGGEPERKILQNFSNCFGKLNFNSS